MGKTTVLNGVTSAIFMNNQELTAISKEMTVPSSQPVSFRYNFSHLVEVLGNLGGRRCGVSNLGLPIL